MRGNRITLSLKQRDVIPERHFYHPTAILRWAVKLFFDLPILSLRSQVTLFATQAFQLFLFAAGACTSSILVGGHQKFHGGKHYSYVLGLVASCVMAAAVVGAHVDDASLGGGQV